jgi:XTP/dITP diphosphohydrolase
MARVLLATRNAKKLDELRRILEPVAPGVVLVGLDDVPPYEEVPESGLTFAENALIKAREGAAHTGMPTVADDSGLAVDALNGMPGVFSARWAGRHGSQAARDRANLDLLLAQIADVPDEHRAASFVCVAALAYPDGRELTVEGTMRGRLVRAPRGDGGFGYDPIFIADGRDVTNAELTAADKDEISHRGRAFRALAPKIASIMKLTS